MPIDTDRNLLFGVLALQAGLLDAKAFAEACSAWAATKDSPLADLLVERGLLTADERALVDSLLERTVKKHGSDVRASLAAVAGDRARRTLSEAADPVIQETLTPPPDANGQSLPETLGLTPETRDRYALMRVHAEGGIGRVWVARDESLGREVALKELRPESAGHPAIRARFVEEAKVTAQLEHPGIVSVHELSERPITGEIFYTMRLVKGRTLSDAIHEYHELRRAGKAGPLEFRALLGNFASVCNAVGYAHSRGVLHRDLKPQNVVLGDFGEVVVLDWGLAKLKANEGSQGSLLPVTLQRDDSRGETLAGVVLGTPAYMSPEQAEGRIDLIDERSDVYGLRVVLYQILSDSPPFKGANTPEIIAKVVQGSVVPARQLVPTVPVALEAICLKALAKLPAKRYGTAKAVGKEIQNWLADEPVEAYRDRIVYRVSRWGRRHRAFRAALMASFVTAFLIVSHAIYVVYQAERQRVEALRREGVQAEVQVKAMLRQVSPEDQYVRACFFSRCIPVILKDVSINNNSREALVDEIANLGQKHLKSALEAGFLKVKYQNEGDELAAARRLLEVQQLKTNLQRTGN